MRTYEQYKDKIIQRCKQHGLSINIDNPITIQDKINWLKIYDSTPLKTKCADKIQLHDYSIEKLGKDICIPILKVYNNTTEINWSELPNQFVIKCNHGSGMNIIVKDKSKLNKEETKKKLQSFMATDFALKVCYEMHYQDIPHKIFAEEYKYDEAQKQSLFDYKFWCFNGIPKMYTINDGIGHGDIVYYDMNDNILDPYKKYKPTLNYKKPNNFDKMIEYSKILSEDFKFVRVDFYEINNEVYLGELTFTPGAGFFKYADTKYHKIIGDMLTL